MPLFIVLALLIALATVLFALQNTAPVLIQFFGLQLQEPLALVLLITLGLGVIVGLLVAVPSVVRRSMTIASQKRKLQDLDYEVQERDRTLVAEHSKLDIAQQKSTELLTALGLTTPTSGLLKGESMVTAVSYVLHHIASDPGRSPHESACVYVLEVEPEAGLSTLDQALHAGLHQAVAQRLRRVSGADSWLFHDGQARFGCVHSGMTVQAAADRGEALRESFADHPLELAEDIVVPVTIDLAGAIARTTDIDAYDLLQQAEATLEQAKRRGKNRFKLTEVKL
ncbi:MAG: DUF1049 domain-containing protein [Kaiparowitsia implicata GSE-PSE-MK54-09C]|jgi:uncharacterized integral membrane protein|nr:DUF1049 domain-containing protein [Kaiparowitsia implicata GSE-PSE-MK54-09C]